jgi:hypothetical protein
MDKRNCCARRDRVVHQRMNANGFLLLKQVNNSKTLQYGYTEHYYYLHTKWRLFTVLRTLCTMGPCCHAGLVFQSSWLLHECVASSSAADQLLILLPAWRAGPYPIPLPQVDLISLRVHAPSCSLIGYNYIPY